VGAEVMTKRWYVVHTYSGHENKVKTNLEKAIEYAGLQNAFGEILVVTEEFAEMKNGKRTVSKKKTFPSYVLVEMEITAETQSIVQNIPGVTRFVGTGGSPMALRKDEVDRILNQDQEAQTRTTTEVPFKVGEHVRVIDGPFNDFTGVVDVVDQERGKVKVMVSIFGRATPVELDFLQVKEL
jgi:transcriptional antiterminator NusG